MKDGWRPPWSNALDVQLNTLYLTTRGASVRQDHLTLRVFVENQCRLTVPIHQIESVVVFGMIHITPAVLQLCAEHDVAVSFHAESGKLLSRVCKVGSGNILLRRTQFRWADDAAKRSGVAKCVVAGKVQNARNVLLRGAREADADLERTRLEGAAAHLADVLPRLESATDVDTIRGHEGDAARVYFDAFDALVRQQREHFRMEGRSRRPPLDPVNALLSFAYALLLNDCSSALQAAGLDPEVGFLHVDRPGRPGLALDLMEEFRHLIADRLVLTLINRQQVKPEGFAVRDGGSVEMDEATRKTLLSAWQQRKKEEVTHPLLEQKAPVGRLPFLQARILARHLRGDLPSYVPCILKS
jgi:CRISP-associated protein Cas1